MSIRCWLFVAAFCLLSTQTIAAPLPTVTGLALDGNQLTRDAQEGAAGYNIHRDYAYFDTMRDTLNYTVT